MESTAIYKIVSITIRIREMIEEETDTDQVDSLTYFNHCNKYFPLLSIGWIPVIIIVRVEGGWQQLPPRELKWRSGPTDKPQVAAAVGRMGVKGSC